VDPDTDLRLAGDSDVAVLERLWQLDSTDMSAVRGTFPNAEGLFKAGRFPTYFGDPDRCAYLITQEGAPAGFAFLTGLVDEPRTIGEFFVVHAARRRRLGYDVARTLIERHPGRWEIGFQGSNTGAAELWRRIAADLDGDGWREERRPVPNKPWIPDDHFVVFAV